MTEANMYFDNDSVFVFGSELQGSGDPTAKDVAVGSIMLIVPFFTGRLLWNIQHLSNMENGHIPQRFRLVLGYTIDK
uniref:Transporter n=1 Tax=Steinernema glaseri TaxID=37863 RepID=A0A1I8ALB5_9BILA